MTSDLPRVLQDLVIFGGDDFKLSVASDEDLDSLKQNIASDDYRHCLSHWTVVKIEALASALFVMIGMNELGETWCTSIINGIDLKKERVVTNNNVYALGKMQVGEPDLQLMLHLSNTLRAWGVEERFRGRVKFLDLSF